MDTTHIITKILAIYFLANGVFLVARRKTLPLLIKDLYGHPATLWVAGLILIILGSVIAFSDNNLAGSWGSAYTVLGWLTILKGFLYIVYPKILQAAARNVAKSSTVIYGVILIALAVLLLAV